MYRATYVSFISIARSEVTQRNLLISLLLSPVLNNPSSRGFLQFLSPETPATNFLLKIP